MADLIDKYPQLADYIRDTRKAGYSDTAIEKVILEHGYKPRVGVAFDQRDSSFMDVLSEKFTIEKNESFMEFIGDVFGLPQAVATGGLAKLFGEEESFTSMVSRSVKPSEFLPKETPGFAKFVTDLVADPLNLMIFGGLASKAVKGLKAGAKVVKGAETIAGGGKIIKSAAEVANMSKEELIRFAAEAPKDNLIKIIDDLKDLAFKGDVKAAFARDILKQESGAAPKFVQSELSGIINLESEGLAMNLAHINPKVQSAIRDAWKEAVEAGKIEAIDPKIKPYIHQFVDAVSEGKLDVKGDIIDKLIAKGMTKEEAIAEVIGFTRETVSQAARTLANERVWLSKLNKALKGDPVLKQYSDELNELLTDMDNTGFLSGFGLKRLDNIRRGLLVTQLATSDRNAISQVARVGLDVIEQGFQAGLQRLFGRPQTAHPADMFAVFTEILKQLRHPIRAFKGGISDADKILALYPRLNNRLFMHYASDIYTGAGKAERVVDLLNTANRFQEWTIRRAVFTAKLRTLLRNQGKNLTEIIKNNQIKGIPEDLLKQAIDYALEFTFAAQPKYGSVGHAFVNFINKMPGATFAIPFPRFMVNSMKFLWDFSPAGVLKLMSSRQWAKMAAGDFKTISRAIIGTGMLGAAWQVRNSEWAGERWYEIRLPNGKTWDTRAYNPFAAYLFVADLVKRAKEGTLNRMTTKDIAMGVLSTNLRAGTGLYILDSFIEGLVGLKTPDKALRKLKEFSGEVVGGIFTPLQTITDVLSEFDDSIKIIRDRRIEPFMGPIKARIPGLLQTLEPLRPATREEPYKRIGGALRQLTGVALREPKNVAERELDRLGFSFTEILRPTGEPEIDRLIAKHMGKLVEERIGRVVKSKRYQRLSNAARGEKLRNLLNKLRAIARKRAKRENPKIFRKLKEKRMPRRKRRYLEELTGGIQ